MITALFGIGQLVALAAIIYGALLTLRNRPHFWERVGRALHRVEVFLHLFDQAVRLGELARRDPYTAARVAREQFFTEIGPNNPSAQAQVKPPIPRRTGVAGIGEAA